MRCRLKKAVQIIIVVACLVFYINFVLISRNSLSRNGSGEDDDDDVGEELPEFHVASRKRELKDKDKVVNNKQVVRFEIETERQQHQSELNNETVIYPSLLHYENDRIRNQLKFVPSSVRSFKKTGQDDVPLKTIFLASGLGGWAVKRGQSTFQDQKCAVQHCFISDARKKMKDADVVLFDGLVRAGGAKPAHQIWLLFLLESPYHTPVLTKYADKFNWTATYRRDSTIVAPYEKFVPFNDSVLTKPQTKNYATGKSKMVAWFVSNCGARNRRMQYATELGKHIEVDIYGRCGTLKCPRHQAGKCFDMLNKDYRFYLSFENSNCRDYITEKFFVNGLQHDVIPIVMGGAPEDYRRAAPPHSYIHVDDFKSAKDLADYLHVLATNENLYNEYFQWKGTGDITNTYFWCRVCALAHDVDNRGTSWYEDVNEWWRGGNTCIGEKSWRDITNRPKLLGPLAKQGSKPRLS